MPDESSNDVNSGDRSFSVYGIATAVLAVIAVVAIVLGVIVASGHRDEADELAYRSRVLRTAAEWTSVLVNMNKDTVDASLIKLHEGTIGELNTDFEAVAMPYRLVVQKLQSKTTGQVNSVALESIHHVLPPVGGGPPPPIPKAKPELTESTTRTDTVIVVATSVSENVAGKEPQTVRWNLRLDVSNVGDNLLISRLESIR